MNIKKYVNKKSISLQLSVNSQHSTWEVINDCSICFLKSKQRSSHQTFYRSSIFLLAENNVENI